MSPRRARRAACLAALALAACRTPAAETPPPARGPRVVASEPIPMAGLRPETDVDSLAAALLDKADTLPPARLPGLEVEIRDWLARLEFEDPALVPPDRTPGPFFRRARGLLLDALGWSAFRRGDLRQAEAALVSAADEIHSRGVTDGPALHFWHLGRVLEARGRRAQAIEAYLAAEQRGMGRAATLSLEVAWRRRAGSLRGLDAARARERARIEDERRQNLVAYPRADRLPPFDWPTRTGPPMTRDQLLGKTTVLAAWGPQHAGWPASLRPLADALRARGVLLVGVWLGPDPAGAGPPLGWPVLAPPDPARARGALAAPPLPALLVVDETGAIRYRHAGTAVAPPPIDDVILQVEHLERRRRRAGRRRRVPIREDR